MTEDEKKNLLVKIVYASDVSDKLLDSVAQRFAEANNVQNYTVDKVQDDTLISGFVVYALGNRFDYSLKGRIDKLGLYIKKSSDDACSNIDEVSDDVALREIGKSLEDIVSEFDFNNEFSISSTSVAGDFDDDGHLDDGEKKILDVAKSFGAINALEEVGMVTSVSDGVAYVSGLAHCMASELLVFENGTKGIAMNLESEQIGVVVLSNDIDVVEGILCKRTHQTVSIPVGNGMLGRVVDPLGNPIDGKGIIRTTNVRTIESPAPTIIDRSPVNKPLHTGITAIDALTPIGRGQRELIIGDRQTGKTAIAIDTIINQKDKDVICVYVAIGQKMSTIASTVNLLRNKGALKYTVVVAASSADTASLQYIAPFSGCAIAEEFMYTYNKDVLIIYDDLSKHAQAYRAISLLLRRPPGREAYPGDVFYLHSRLLERAAKLSDEKGGGSLTALPIIETLGDDISAYIPTNVISITDGQIYLAPELFFAGQRPAINVGLSVSRVGGAAQTKATKKVGGPLRIALAQAREMASFAQFGSDLDENTRLQLQRGVVLNEVLKQEQYSPLAMEEQVVILHMATSDSMNFLEKEDIKEFYSDFLSYINISHKDILYKIKSTGVFDDDIKEKVNELLNEYKTTYISQHPEYQEML